MRKLLLSLALGGCMLAHEASAVSLLVQQAQPYNVYGYGLNDWTGMTAALDASFGPANITVNATPLSNLAYLTGFDSLWITLQASSSLSAQEIANVQAFAATGRRVVLVGENSSYTTWNSSILQIAGGGYSGMNTWDALTPVLSHPLTAGITELGTDADGIASGGTPLFSENVATLWGGSQNVLSLLSVNVIEDSLVGGAPGNQQFKLNLADWLAGGTSQVPDIGGTVALFASVLIGLLAIRHTLAGRAF